MAQTRDNKLKALLQEMDSLQSQINVLQNHNCSTYNNDFELLKKEIENLKKQKNKFEKKMKYNKKKIYKHEETLSQQNERDNMLKEEYFSCKKLLIMLTSKIESHSEFIKTLCKTRNALTSSLEKLNEIDPDNSEFSNNVIEMNKLAEMIYSYCNEYLEFNTSYDEFIDKIKNQDDIDKVIEYLQEISKYKIPKNLYEYVLIALCRIMTYEKILDLRMNFISIIDENEQKNKDSKRENGIIHKIE
jgi:chromosome segregation ATPase